jgi:hypothetical protein
MRGIRVSMQSGTLSTGEVNIYKEDFNDFLVIAEELELKGLTGIR